MAAMFQLVWLDSTAFLRHALAYTAIEADTEVDQLTTHTTSHEKRGRHVPAQKRDRKAEV
jgi:hypothetical protein